MFILFGTRGIKHIKNDGDIINNSCPSCNSGNLVNKIYRRWFTLFFIPVVPLDTIDKFYECDSCGESYKENIKSVLNKSQKEQENANEKSVILYAKATIAAMTHMALVDGDFNINEDREIMNVIEEYKNYRTKLLEIIEKIKREKNSDDFVFNILNEARNLLSAEALLNILSRAGVVLLADGKIAKQEENLFKEYLIACGLPKSMYIEIITKIKNKDQSRYLSS